MGSRRQRSFLGSGAAVGSPGRRLSDKVAVVTGAASGIGRALAIQLAREGCHLAISDVDEDGLRATAARVANGIRVTQHRLDVSDRDAVHRHAEEVTSEHGQADIVVNNAGVALSARLDQVGYDDFEWLMGINFWGVVYGSKAFVPILKQRPWAHIANISSVHGLFTNRRVGPYCCSKFAVRGFTLTLAQELRNTNIVVSCVHPGGIKTNIIRNSRFYGEAGRAHKEEAASLFDKYIAHTTAERAAKTIVAGIQRDRSKILVGADANIYDILSRLMPTSWQRLMAVL